MAEPRSWDVQGLAFGLALGFLGVLFVLGRNGENLQPAHLLGVVVLAVGTAFLVDAVDRNWHHTADEPTRDVVELP